jgi:outer membrane protein TolC
MNPFKPSHSGLVIIVSWAAAGILVLSGCLHRPDNLSLKERVAPSSDRLWKAPPGPPSQPEDSTKTLDIPEDLLVPGKKWRLTDIIEIALGNNPQTRATWHAARGAAADWYSTRGDYYPKISATATGSHLEVFTEQTGKDDSMNSFLPELELSWLLFDFGGRKASVAEKQKALLVADFTHNAAIQDSVFLVLQTYFQYTNAKVLLTASQSSLKEASTNLEMAKQRHDNGLATIADVLLAKTALSQARLNLDILEGQVQILKGSLATAMGLPANTAYDTEDLASDPPVDHLMEDVETHIRQAQARRPDLAAQKSRVEQAMAVTDVKRSALYPNLSLYNSLAGSLTSADDDWNSRNTTALLLNIPLFEGYSRQYDLQKAGEDAETQKARLETLQQSIILQVWTSYFDLKTSMQRVKTTNDLLDSARQSYEVAAGRYKEGVGGILDLLSAQSSLESARAQKVVARASWYIAFSRLARDTGSLWRQSDITEPSVLDLIPGTTVKERP